MSSQESVHIAKDLVAASAAPLILAILAEEDNYGYAILKRVRELSGGQVGWSEGMLYPLLHRLEERGLIRSRSVRSSSGPPRKFYVLNKKGHRHLESSRVQWRLMNDTLERAWVLTNG
ncbi:MAG: PadR family transcriptional regulator [Planctomycetota bacterium]